MEAPNCDEESSDVDDSCEDESYDSDVMTALSDSPNNISHFENLPLTRREKFDRRFCLKERELLSSQAERASFIAQKIVRFSTYQVPELILLCRTGMYIGITTTGRVETFSVNCMNDSNAYARIAFIICPVSNGLYRLQNAETSHCLALNSNGHLYGEKNMTKDTTRWEHWKIAKYDAFRSHKFSKYDWWLGIKKNGRLKSGPETAWGQKAIQFMIISST